MGKIDPAKKSKRGKEAVSGSIVPVPKNTMETCVFTPLPDNPTKEADFTLYISRKAITCSYENGKCCKYS